MKNAHPQIVDIIIHLCIQRGWPAPLPPWGWQERLNQFMTEFRHLLPRATFLSSPLLRSTHERALWHCCSFTVVAPSLSLFFSPDISSTTGWEWGSAPLAQYTLEKPINMYIPYGRTVSSDDGNYVIDSQSNTSL